MNGKGVCPLISMTEPLKRLGDYPKCMQDKCEWWMANSCVFTILGTINQPLGDIAQSLAEIARVVVDPYAASYSSNSLVQAIKAIGAIGDLVETHKADIGGLIIDLKSLVIAKLARDAREGS